MGNAKRVQLLSGGCLFTYDIRRVTSLYCQCLSHGLPLGAFWFGLSRALHLPAKDVASILHTMIQKNVAGLRVILPNKNPFVRRAANGSFMQYYGFFNVVPTTPPHTFLAFNAYLEDGHFYRWTYQFPAIVNSNPDISVPGFWSEQCNRSYFWFTPFFREGGNAFNICVRPFLVSKVLLF